MTKITILFSQTEYALFLKVYLTNRLPFQIIRILLWSIIIITVIFYILKIGNINIWYSILWCGLMIVYEKIIPNLIYKKAENIYKNTLFLHQEMSLEFDSNQVIWKTIQGQNTFKLNNIYQIKALKEGLIISLTPYIVIPIKYTSISSNQWNQLIKYLSLSKKAINYYNKLLNKELS